MLIVHIITRFIRGGADENTLLTCNGQAELGHQVHLVAGDHHPDMVKALDPRVTFHHFRSLVRAPRPLDDSRFYFQMKGFLKRLKPDIVHTHESKAGVLGRLAAKAARVPHIVHGVHILPFVGVGRAQAAVYLGLEKLAARTTHAFVDVSDGMRRLCLDNGLGTAANHHVVPSGMDTARFRNAVPLARDEIVPGRTVAPDTVIGLISGTLEPRKRVTDLVAQLADKAPDGNWLLLVAGTGAEEAALRTLVAQRGLGGKVVLLGHRGDLDRVIATADICLHAAANEGLPRVVVQYVLGARPVVSTALPGIERVVRPGLNGDLAPVESVEQVAALFLALAADPERRARYSEGAESLDLSGWDHHAMVAAIEQAYAAIGATAKAAA